MEDAHAVVGVDLGLRNILSVSDSSGRKWNIPGDEATRKREKFRRTRASLQAKGTKGAKRVLKRVAGRENRWVADASHCIAKALVQAYGPGTLFVLEDLTGISTNEKNHHGREQTGELCSWPFASLGDKIAYKAMLQGSMCIHVDPYNTSNRCPVCGQVDKKARDRNTHVYTCKRCGHTEDDDFNGADNILELGMRYLCGEEEPSYRKKKKRGPSGSAA